jgi:hypothetical protein
VHSSEVGAWQAVSGGGALWGSGGGKARGEQSRCGGAGKKEDGSRTLWHDGPSVRPTQLERVQLQWRVCSARVFSGK